MHIFALLIDFNLFFFILHSFALIITHTTNYFAACTAYYSIISSY